MTMNGAFRHLIGALALAWAGLAAVPAQAQLFGDDQARQAILDLRQRFDQAVTAQNRLVDENTQMRRSMLDLQQQIESLRGDLARLRGQEEQFTRDISELQKRQASTQESVEQRLAKLEQAQPAASPEAGVRLRSKLSTDSARDAGAASPVAVPRMSLPTPSTMQSATLRSSRTLPGQVWAISLRICSGGTAGSGRSWRWAARSRKCSSSRGMSSRRSRRGGRSMVTTLRR